MLGTCVYRDKKLSKNTSIYFIVFALSSKTNAGFS